MFRFLFYLAFGYIILKIVRIFIDPFFSNKTVNNSNPSFVPKPEEKKSNLGDYVEFEEVK